MTKKDLERRNKYLLLQLKMIYNLANLHHNGDELQKAIGSIIFHSSHKTIKENLRFIEKYDEQFNFFDKEEDISDYE